MRAVGVLLAIFISSTMNSSSGTKFANSSFNESMAFLTPELLNSPSIAIPITFTSLSLYYLYISFRASSSP